MAIAKQRHSRNQVFDLLRIALATSVLLAHAVEQTDGNRSRELFSRLTGSSMSFGEVGVDGFFLLSGYLIVQSWESDPEFWNYLRKRLLRIVPGYLVAVLLSVVVLGLVAPGVPHFFKQLRGAFVISVVTLSYPNTPPVMPGLPYPAVNGSLWTIAYEFRCYFLVALAGLCGVYRRPMIWLGATVVLLVAMAAPAFTGQFHLPHRLVLVSGEVTLSIRLTAVYFIGGCFHLFRRQISYRPILLGAAVAGIAVVQIFDRNHLELAVALFGGYLMFYLALSQLSSRVHIKWLPDISYGIYLYGWPVESLWIWYRHGSPWVTFLAATLISTVLGWLSWHYVERPMLKLKRRSAAPLPAP